MATSAVVLDKAQYVRVNAGYTSLLLQAHNDSVRIVMSNSKPARSNPTYHLLGGKDPVLPIPIVDVNVWALAVSDRSSLIVTESSTLFPVQVCDLNNRPISDSIGYSLTTSDVDHYLIHIGKTWVQSDTFTLDAGLIRDFILHNDSAAEIHLKDFKFTSDQGSAEIVIYRDPTYTAPGTALDLRNKNWDFQTNVPQAKVYHTPTNLVIGTQDEHFQITGGKQDGGSEQGGGDEWVIPAGRKMLIRFTNTANQLAKVSYTMKILDIGTL